MSNSEKVVETEEKNSKLFSILDRIGVFILIILGLNLLVEIIVTIIAISIVQDYLTDFISFGQITVVAIILVVVIPVPFSFGYAWIGAKIRKWDEDRKDTHIVVSYLLLLGLLFIVMVLILFFIGLPFYPELQDPFQLNNDSSSVIGTLFLVWWFFGFIISAIGIAIVVMGILAENPHAL
ncbi:MAG: hypothetical protein ACXADY_15985 [Candidatus Hodarchaeales archaeon]|jgi:hypothetical protein